MIKKIKNNINKFKNKNLLKQLKLIQNIESINFDSNGNIDIFGFSENSKEDIIKIVNSNNQYFIDYCEFFQTSKNFFIMIEKK